MNMVGMQAILVVDQNMLDKRSQTHGEYMTCTAISQSGVNQIGPRIIIQTPLQIATSKYTKAVLGILRVTLPDRVLEGKAKKIDNMMGLE